MEHFSVARNPNRGARAPLLIRIPAPRGALVLESTRSWPDRERDSRELCFDTGVWPDNPELIESVPVRFCRQRGSAIDLVLDRETDSRSQFVFGKDQEGVVVWQAATRELPPTQAIINLNGNDAGPSISLPDEPTGPTTRQVRAWALENGFDVTERGRIRREVWDAYRSALV